MNGHEQGFTVVEALVAFAILSVALTWLYASSGTSLHALERTETLDRAVLLAESRLAEIGAMRTALPQVSQGRFPGSNVRWRIDAAPVEPNPSGTLRLQDVHLVLTWDEDDGGREIAIDTRHLGRAVE